MKRILPLSRGGRNNTSEQLCTILITKSCLAQQSLGHGSLGSQRDEPTKKRDGTTEHGYLEEAAVLVQQGAVDGRPDQRPEPGHEQCHAQVRSRLPRVGDAHGEGGRGARDDGAGPEADDDGVHDQARRVGGLIHAEDDDAREDAAHGKGVHAAHLVGEDAWNDAAEEGGGVQDCERVPCQCRLDAQGCRVRGNVEERGEDAHKEEEHGCHYKLVCPVFEDFRPGDCDLGRAEWNASLDRDA